MIAYTKLELLHATLVMHLCVIPVVLLVMWPVLLRSGQYLHVVVWLQVWNPRSLKLVPLLVVVSLCVLVSLEVALGTVGGVLGLAKSNMDVCLSVRGAMSGGAGGTSGGAM